ncbi:Probable polysaccharide biosynthesis protein [Flavobacterium indicum GPTSA100-9 = DSM 17447]|uniref:Probable polysaccharide biosynthesis protein n=1 Tax=Flavobacterium indicum (strain DSM 17447 / CIP 109464 / GPTSA100-9) TaxID=1094466 RepID=H8XS82_FLAIG|nr:polysaccharide biosynthesis protein [Flavobacterium indicum]CCG54666.1 Probable polysaccharide biosynthesis protein [Flavobacterium indicum GPTSA100-9 = DSM 17447]
MKFNLSYFYYILSLLVLFLNNYELTFIIWLFIAFLTFKLKYSKQIFYIISCYSIIILISFLTEFLFYDHNLYNKVRDLTYLLKPILGLLIGYNISKEFKLNALQYAVKAGVILSFIHLLLVFFAILNHRTLSVSEIREHSGYFNDYEPFVLLLLFFSNSFQIQLTKKQKLTYIVIVGISVFSYLSRTNFLQLILLFLAIKGYFILTARSIKVISLTVIISLIGYFAIYNYNPKRKGSFVDEFLYKVKIIPIEAFKTKINKEDWKDFNDNFRSFENIKTFNQITYGGIQPILTGNGLGSTVDIGRRMQTNDGTIVRYYPALHNAFSTVLLKSGIIGVFFYLLSIFIIFNKIKTNSKEIFYLNNLIKGSAIFLLLSSWVFMGFYLKLDSKSILIGLLIGYREVLNNHLAKAT